MIDLAFTGYIGQILGKICLKKVFAPYFFFEKRSAPPCRWSRPGYSISFDPPLRILWLCPLFSRPWLRETEKFVDLNKRGQEKTGYYYWYKTCWTLYHVVWTSCLVAAFSIWTNTLCNDWIFVTSFYMCHLPKFIIIIILYTPIFTTSEPDNS